MLLYVRDTWTDTDGNDLYAVTPNMQIPGIVVIRYRETGKWFCHQCKDFRPNCEHIDAAIPWHARLMTLTVNKTIKDTAKVIKDKLNETAEQAYKNGVLKPAPEQIAKPVKNFNSMPALPDGSLPKITPSSSSTWKWMDDLEPGTTVLPSGKTVLPDGSTQEPKPKAPEKGVEIEAFPMHGKRKIKIQP